jgi:hypothetical protein
MYEIGYRASSTYYNTTSLDKGTSTSESGVISALTAMGYTTPGSFSSYNIFEIRNSIEDNKPVIVEGWTDEGSFLGITWGQGTGHYWLIDGVRTMIYSENFVDNTTYYASNGLSGGGHESDPVFVRCNLGWNGGIKNAWYLNGIFDCRNNHQSRARANKIDRYYQYQLEILPNVNWGGE